MIPLDGRQLYEQIPLNKLYPPAQLRHAVYPVQVRHYNGH